MGDDVCKAPVWAGSSSYCDGLFSEKEPFLQSLGGGAAKAFVERVQLPGGLSGAVSSLAVKVPSSQHSSAPAGSSSPAWIPRKSAGKELPAACWPAVRTHRDRKTNTLRAGDSILKPVRC